MRHNSGSAETPTRLLCRSPKARELARPPRRSHRPEVARRDLDRGPRVSGEPLEEERHRAATDAAPPLVGRDLEAGQAVPVQVAPAEGLAVEDEVVAAASGSELEVVENGHRVVPG